MKLAIGVIAVLALAAGPTWAQQASWGSKPHNSWTPGGAPKPSAPKSYGVPSATPAPAYSGRTTAKIYGPPATPKAEPFKPYQPYKPSSVFGPDGKKTR
ncbi:MAG: hypothetical protein EPO51_06660 [Phenylobacterium sp.]|uniref:hypothetical protein n=1 Tax=Phenylobacterium sp. TaxID=1871053 RepID=UPI00120CBF07|nr:hypothetical protein [Phenylobacterium sp.]TAJ73313.1 MAG: hypothetical protein EPO51_06660 [Phenylobacterium sp.]